MERIPSPLTLFGIVLLFVALCLMVPIGYFGKDIVSPWCLAVGAPLAWLGFGLCSRGKGLLLSVGGGFLVACTVALIAQWLGTLLTGHVLRDLLCVSPLFYLSFRVNRRSKPNHVPDAGPSPLVVVKVLFLTAIGLAILLVGVVHARLLDTYPYPLGATVGLAIGYVLFRQAKPVAPAPYYALFFVAAPLGLTSGGLINRYGDTSAPTEHAAEVLSVESSNRGISYCFVASWRGSWTERLNTSHVPCPVHGKIAVRTRAGLLGWPWIESARAE